MKKMVLLLSLVMIGQQTVEAYCTNKNHARIRGKRGSSYQCSVKPRVFYTKLKNQKIVNMMYDQEGKCKTCGCFDAAHK